MINKYLFGVLAAGMAISATGATPQFKLPAIGADPVQQSRPMGLKKVAGMSKTTTPRISSKKAAGPKRVMASYGSANAEIEKYGSLRLLLEEDFSLLTTGSEDMPDFMTKLEYEWDDPLFLYPWWNFRPEYTHTPHWGVGGAYPAGGCLYFHCEAQQAHVNTALVDCTTAEGNVAVLEFRARAYNPGTTFDALIVEAADTRNMGPSWDILEDMVVFSGITDQWETYRVVYRGAGPTTLFNIVGSPKSEAEPGYVLIDDIKVYQLEPNVAMPEILAHTDYKGESFTANWKSVEGADKYIVNVWALDSSTGEKDFIVEDEEVAGNATSYNVNNAVSGRTYYYNVTAVKGDQKSLPSFDMRVYDLEAPVMNEAVVLDKDKYKASWKDVPGADVYNYYAYNQRTATESGEFVVTDEDFTGVLDSDGYPTGWIKEDPQPYTYDTYYCNEVHQQGWVGTNAAPYDDYIALDAYHYVMSGSLSAWMSPEMDFSKDGGKFTVDVDLAANTTTLYDEDDNEYNYTTQACAVIFNWDEAVQDYVQAEIWETQALDEKDKIHDGTHHYAENPVEFDWRRYKFEFTKGSERTKFAICAVQSYDNLYIDNLKITQNYVKGESLMDPFRYKRFHGFREGEVPTELEIEIPWWAGTTDDIYHKVSAFSRQADQYGQSYDDRESAYSALNFVMKGPDFTGVETINGDASNVKRIGENIIINNPEGAAVSVYTIGGQCLLNTTNTYAVVTLNAHGVYVVRVGQQTYKVAY